MASVATAPRKAATFCASFEFPVPFRFFATTFSMGGGGEGGNPSNRPVAARPDSNQLGAIIGGRRFALPLRDVKILTRNTRDVTDARVRGNTGHGRGACGLLRLSLLRGCRGYAVEIGAKN